MTPPSGRRDLAVLAFLLALGVGVPLAMAVAAGAIGVPSNDDWVYMLGADSLYRTGSFAMPGHTASAVGQIALVQPLLWLSGGASWAYSLFGLGMAAIGLVAAYLLARTVTGPGPAALAALLMIAFPGFARESATFMTDVPTFALEMVSLLLGAWWLRSGRWPALVASLVVGLLGVAFREFAIAAPAAVLTTAWARGRPQERVRLLALSVLATVGTLAILASVGSPAVTGGIPAAATSEGDSTPGPLRLALLGPTLTTLAAVLLPAAVLLSGRRLSTLRPIHLIAALVLVGIPFVAIVSGPFLGQTWTTAGVTGNDVLSGIRDPVIGGRLWSLSEELALLGAVLLVALTLRWGQGALGGARTLPVARDRLLAIGRAPTALLLVFVVFYAGELAAAITVNLIPLDRYLYPVVPVAAALLLAGATRIWAPGRSQVFGHVALVWLGVSALAIAANSFAYDAARWRAGEAAVSLGLAPAAVDAGYEWDGLHAGGHVNVVKADYGYAWYDDVLLPTPPCAIVSNTPLQATSATLAQTDVVAYRQYLFIGPLEPLYLYRSSDPACRG